MKSVLGKMCHILEAVLERKRNLIAVTKNFVSEIDFGIRSRSSLIKTFDLMKSTQRTNERERTQGASFTVNKSYFADDGIIGL